MKTRKIPLAATLLVIALSALSPAQAHDDHRHEHSDRPASGHHEHTGKPSHHSRHPIIVDHHPQKHEIRRHRVYTYYGSPLLRPCPPRRIVYIER